MKQSLSLFVGFNPQTDPRKRQQLHTELGTKLLSEFAEIHVDVVEVLQKDSLQIIRNYQTSSFVSFVEENPTFGSCQTVNDPFYEKPVRTAMDGCQSQWGLRRVNPGPAWEAARNLEHKVTIAILDTGIDPEHPDLAGKIVHPVNFTSKNRDEYLDYEGHGTHVAGIAAAITNNKIGIAGISFNTAEIMPVKVIGPKGGQTKWVIAGILYAVHHGAKVINISFGAAPYSQALQLAINYAWEKGAVMVAAAGNEGKNLVEYPAGYNFVLAVSAVTKTNDLASFSNRGINIGITAPGTAILSTMPTYHIPNKMRDYDILDGTSQATPFISGLAALLFAIYPEMTNAEVLQIIQKAADPIEEDHKSWNPFFGYGLLNAANAVKRKTGSMIFRKNNKCSFRWKSSDKRTSRRRSYRRRSQSRKYHKKADSVPSSQVKKGCFYGQVVDQHGTPLANATVSARFKGKIASSYTTRSNVPIEGKEMGTDGMFRLGNLLPETYSLYVKLPGKKAVQIQKATITGGADTFLQLICDR